MFTRLLIITALISLVATDKANAQKLFAVNVNGISSETSEPLDVIQSESSSLTDLLEDLVRTEADFTVLAGNIWNANLTYFAVPNTFQIISDADATRIVVASEVTGLVEVFEGETNEAVFEAIEDWFLSDGADALAEIEQNLLTRSAVSVTDGNPSATTARLAENAFQRFGGGLSRKGHALWSEQADSFSIGLEFNASRRSAETGVGDIETDRWEVRAPMHIRFFDTFNLLGLASFEYLDIAGSRVYGGGGQLGVPFKLYSNAEAERTWVLTPNVGIEGRGGIDIASGNIMLQVGLTSHYTMRATERLKLTIINQVSTFESLTLKYDDIEFKPDIDQWIVKNEIAFDLQMNAWSVLSASLTDTRFLNEAAIDDYQDLEIGLAATTGSFWTISTFARHTFANGYDATTAGAYVDFGF